MTRYSTLVTILLVLGYTLSQGMRCDPTNCLTCSTSGQCTACLNSYISNGKCGPVPAMQDKNCLVWGANSKCLQCKTGYSVKYSASIPTNLQQGIISCV